MSMVTPANPPGNRSTTPPHPEAPPTLHGSSGHPFTLRRVRHFVGNHQLSVFLLLAIGLSWWPWLLSPGDLNPLGPAVAAFIVVALSEGDSLKRFARRVLDVRLSPPWLAAAILVPAVVVVGAVLVNTFLGGPAPTGTQLGLWTGLPLEFFSILVFIGLGEEIGWTAFAAPRALAGRTFLTAFVLLIGMRALWHLPFLLSGEMPWVSFLGMAAFQFLILLIYRRSGGQWVSAAIFHTVNNTLAGSFLFQMVDGPDLLRLFAIQAALYTLIAIGALILDRGRPLASSTQTATAAQHEAST